MSIKSDFCTQLSSFVSEHKILCIATFGLAIPLYAIGNLAGRVVSSITDCVGIAKKTEDAAKKRISSQSGSKVSTKPLKPIVESKIERIKTSFATFIDEFETEILPFYESHEKGFDSYRIHGRMHVARAVIFSEVMARYYQTKGKSVDFDYVRRTTGMHDSGRKGNGIDLWEKESSALLYNYFISKNMTEKEARQKSKIVIKEQADENSIEFKIFQSADCLDIMRPCTGRGGRSGFNANFLSFLKENPSHKFRQDLIEEAWIFIQITEQVKTNHFNENKGFMKNLFKIIQKNQRKLPILSSILPIP